MRLSAFKWQIDLLTIHHQNPGLKIIKWHSKASGQVVRCSQEQKIQAAMDYYIANKKPKQLAEEYGVTTNTIFKWRDLLLSGEMSLPLSKKEKIIVEPKASNQAGQNIRNEIDELKKQAEELKDQVYHLKLEKDALEMVAKIIKKAQGVSLETLTNREKSIVIDALRKAYKLKELLPIFRMSKSSYCYQKVVINAPDKYMKIRKKIRQEFIESNGTYGYRRIHSRITRDNTRISEKIVRQIMLEENLIIKQKKRRKYNSYQGEITPAVANLLEQNFHADKPNEKWLTDITEFHIPAGKVYLSPIIDCFDGLPVSWSIGTSPDAELVNTMLDNAIASLKEGEYPICHSDRGGHYRWPGWIDRIEKANLTRSMSRKGCSPDNSACEGFFGRLKNEMFYDRSWGDLSIEEFIEKLDCYIHWYAEKRIKMSLGGMSPLEYRRKLKLAV